jgi:hypothetical protein
MVPTRIFAKFEITPNMFIEPNPDEIEFFSEDGSGINSHALILFHGILNHTIEFTGKSFK